MSRLSIGSVILFIACGCTNPRTDAGDAPDDGLVILLPGVEGNRWQFTGCVAGLRDAGIRQRIEIIPWGTPPFSSLSNLQDYPANLKRAQRNAERIAEYRHASPGAPVTLLGYSGGGGLAVLTVEALPEGVTIDRLILVGAALSPDYDLTRSLSRCDDALINFYSGNDWITLGWGTRTFGTIDRKNTDSAGRVGFLDADGKLLRAEKLKQIEWVDGWREFGHWGGHVGWLARGWAREVLSKQIAAASAPQDCSSHPKAAS